MQELKTELPKPITDGLKKLEEIINNSPKVPIKKEKIMVSKDDLVEVHSLWNREKYRLKELRNKIANQEIESASQAEEIISKAKIEAEKIIRQAEQESNKIKETATLKADEILKEAFSTTTSNSPELVGNSAIVGLKDLRISSYSYLETMLNRVENTRGALSSEMKDMSKLFENIEKILGQVSESKKNIKKYSDELQPIKEEIEENIEQLSQLKL